MVKVADSFMLGTENGPEGMKHVIRFGLKVGDWTSISITSNEEFQALALWVNEAQELMRDYAQQARAWVTPSTEPGLFSCMGEEMEELKSFPALQGPA